MFSTLYKWLGIAVAVIMGMAGIYVTGRKSGKDTATVEATRAKMEDVKQDAAAAVEAQQKATTIQVDTVKRANDVATKVNAGDAGAAADKLRAKYSRD